jgi:hypothetical protein
MGWRVGKRSIYHKTTTMVSADPYAAPTPGKGEACCIKIGPIYLTLRAEVTSDHPNCLTLSDHVDNSVPIFSPCVAIHPK